MTAASSTARTRKAPATKAAVELKTNASKNAERKPDLGNFKPGDKVTLKGKDGTWTVVGPAQGGTTLKVQQTQTKDGKTGTTSLFRFARNLTPVKGR